MLNHSDVAQRLQRAVHTRVFIGSIPIVATIYPGKGLMVSRVVWDHETAGSTPATRTSWRTVRYAPSLGDSVL